MALGFRLSRLCKERVTVWRWSETFSGTGKPAGTWTAISAAVPCHVNQKPSQFELQAAYEAGLHVEGDNIFTLDKLDFPSDAAVRAGDVIKVTTGDDLLLGGFWKLRGDIQARTWRAGKQVFIAARLEQAPSGVS